MSGTNLALSNTDLDEMQRTASLLVASGYFTGRADDRAVAIAQLATKIMAGRELGYGPYASVNGIHVIQGKPQVSANLMASAVKANPKYDYKIRKMSDTGVSIEFFENGQSVGNSEFTDADAKRAGTQNMGKYPRNMMFARALSNGVRWFCPDVFNGQSVYVEGEIGGEEMEQPTYIVVDRQTGEVVEPVDKVVKVTEPAPAITSLADVDAIPFGDEGIEYFTVEEGEPKAPIRFTPLDATDEFNSIPSQEAGKVNGQPVGKKRSTLDSNILRRFHAVGHTLYGDGWDDKRPELVKATTKGRSESSGDLTEGEADHLIGLMQKRINNGESVKARYGCQIQTLDQIQLCNLFQLPPDKVEIETILAYNT